MSAQHAVYDTYMTACCAVVGRFDHGLFSVPHSLKRIT